MIYPHQLTIQVRKRQLKDIYGNDVIFTGPNPLSLTAVMGSEDTSWHDFTDYVEGLPKLELEWTVDQTATGPTSAGNFAPQIGVSGTLSFERDAYEFIKQHLVESVSAPLNQIEVQITDTSCGRYVGYVIKSTQLAWCEFNTACVFDLNLKQIEDYTSCIQRTIISDNWQGWFQNEPVDVNTGLPKKHPRFGYCVEKRPNWSLVITWFLTVIAALLYTVIYSVIYVILVVIIATITALVTILNIVIGVINLIIDAVNTLPGVSISHIPDIETPTFPASPATVVDSWAILMLEDTGCGREHPAPLIRDYIDNVCTKCGVRIDATTADIFYAPFLTITHSDGLLHTDPNPFYNACYLFPQVKRGVRRFRNIDLFIGNSNPDNTTYYQPENAPLLSLDMFLDELGLIYNTRWKVKTDVTGTPYLYIKRKDWFENEPPIYDFSYGGTDRYKIVEGICYEPQEYTVPASCGVLYSDDPADKCGVEADGFYNGTQNVSFNNTLINPLFTGILEKNSGFGATHFNCDGSSTNYIYDAFQIVRGSPTDVVTFFITAQLGTYIERYTNYKILMQTDTCTLPKIIIWDGDTANPGNPNYLNATAVRDKINIAGSVFVIGHSGWPGTVPGISIPEVNPLYPTLVPADSVVLPTLAVPSGTPRPVPWSGPDILADDIFNHQPNTNVIGTSGPIPEGVYAVIGLSGTLENPAAAILVNYPMYFEPHYKGTLWDLFHWIDDPYKNPKLHKTFRLKIPLCCDDVTRLNLTNNVNGQALLGSILLDTTFYNKAVITSIKVGYDTGESDTEQGTGQYIELKGIV